MSDKERDLAELNKLLSLIEHLDTKYGRHWISNVKLQEEAIKYVNKVRDNLDRIHKEKKEAKCITNTTA